MLVPTGARFSLPGSLLGVVGGAGVLNGSTVTPLGPDCLGRCVTTRLDGVDAGSSRGCEASLSSCALVRRTRSTRECSEVETDTDVLLRS